MYNKQKEKSQIFKRPKCRCGRRWRQICPKCNVAFCNYHVKRNRHRCPRKRRPIFGGKRRRA